MEEAHERGSGEAVMPFAPVKTLEDLDSLDDSEMQDGYLSTQRGDPEPGENRGRAFWHGWRCRMMDYGELKIDADHMRLVGLWCQRERERRANAAPSNPAGRW